VPAQSTRLMPSNAGDAVAAAALGSKKEEEEEKGEEGADNDKRTEDVEAAALFGTLAALTPWPVEDDDAQRERERERER
jgi:hypothetical protein